MAFVCRINVKYENPAFIGKCYLKVHNYYASMSSENCILSFPTELKLQNFILEEMQNKTNRM